MPNVMPYLAVRDAHSAVDFYSTVFGAEEIGPRITMPDGTIGHTELKIGDGVVMLSEENPEWGNVGPESLGGTSVRLNVDVANADDTVAKTQAAGAEVLMPCADQFYGSRSARIQDPFGHQWIVGHQLEELSNEEIQQRAQQMFGGNGE